MTKEDIFSLINIKDYNNILEQILEKKDFSEDVKSLLLSMLYKIENSYEDYEKVKIVAENKNQYIKDLLNTINECKNIVLAKTNSEEEEILKKQNKDYLIDKNNSKIIVYQNEEELLKALQDYSYSGIELKQEYYFFEEAIKELFKNGFIDSKVEVIRDFNGWSWNINEKQIENKEYNLIYKNMQMILGNEFINSIIYEDDSKDKLPSNEILRSKYEEEKYSDDIKIDYIEKMYKFLEKYEEALGKRAKEDFKKAILSIIYNNNDKEKDKIQKVKEETKNLYKKMQNKKTFLEEQTSIKRNITLEIKQLDNIISDEKVLKKEYEKYNSLLSNDEKVFSPSKYANKLINKRRELLNKIEKINNMMKPMEFVKLKEELKEKNEFFDSLDEKQNTLIENLEKTFLELFNEQINNTQSKAEIIDLIYSLRYYELIPYNDKKIGEVEGLNSQLKDVEKSLIKRACDKKVLVKLSDDEVLNYEILKNIFTSKIIDLEEIIIKLKYNKDILSVEIYDGDIIENSIDIKIKTKTELSVRLKKKIKLFI